MSPVSANTIGLSVAAFISVRTMWRTQRQRFARGAVDLRRTPHGVGVLHATTIGVRGVDAAALDQARQVVGRRRLSGKRPRGVNARVERTHRPLQRVDRQRRGDIGGARQPLGARPAPAPATAVDTCVPLMSARPSFGPSATGCEARAATSAAAAGCALMTVPDLAFADQRERDVRERARGRRWRRPIRGWARADARRRLSAAMSASSVSSANAGEPFRQHVRPQRHRRAHGADRQRLVDARPRGCAAG